MTQIEAIARAILDQIGHWTGATEFKRTIQHDDGTHESLRIDVTEVTAGDFVVAMVRQRNEGPRQEAGPTRLSRNDPRRFATWLAGQSAAKVEA